MKADRGLRRLAVAMCCAAALAACDSRPGPAESAGRKIDQIANDGGKKIAETADKVGEKMKETNRNAAVVVDDAEITARVKAAIFAEPGLKTLQIGVATANGRVSLNGSADSAANSATAGSLASAVGGVTGVDNNLVIKP